MVQKEIAAVNLEDVLRTQPAKDTLAKHVDDHVPYRIKEMLKEFALVSRGWLLSYSKWSSGHIEGVGGSEESSYVLSRGRYPGIIVWFREGYSTSCDERFDYGIPPRVYVRLLDENLRGLFSEVRDSLGPESEFRHWFDCPEKLTFEYEEYGNIELCLFEEKPLGEPGAMKSIIIPRDASKIEEGTDHLRIKAAYKAFLCGIPAVCTELAVERAPGYEDELDENYWMLIEGIGLFGIRHSVEYVERKGYDHRYYGPFRPNQEQKANLSAAGLDLNAILGQQTTTG